MSDTSEEGLECQHKHVRKTDRDHACHKVNLYPSLEITIECHEQNKKLLLTWLMKLFARTIFEKSKQIIRLENDLKIEA